VYAEGFRLVSELDGQRPGGIGGSTAVVDLRIRIRLAGNQLQDHARFLCRCVCRQQLPLIGDLEKQLALPKILGLCGKRFRFLAALVAFVGTHDPYVTRWSNKVPTEGLVRRDR
jgi:hypothetical protein